MALGITVLSGKCRYAECHVFIAMLSVIALNVVILSVIMLNVVMLSAVMLSVIRLSAIMLRVVAPEGETVDLRH
jgi:hypothetical protein